MQHEVQMNLGFFSLGEQLAGTPLQVVSRHAAPLPWAAPRYAVTRYSHRASPMRKREGNGKSVTHSA
jgi:hypothetical protein